jgi:hypothetical protein
VPHPVRSGFHAVLAFFQVSLSNVTKTAHNGILRNIMLAVHFEGF